MVSRRTVRRKNQPGIHRFNHKELIRTKSDLAAWENGCRIDLAAAERVREFFRRFLRHSKGQWAGQPFEPAEWQWRDIILPLFGWKRPDGTRRFRRAYIEIPKKNGKSTLAAAIGLYMLVADGEMGAECYSLGHDRNQASIVHGEAIQMVKASAPLSEILRINASNRTIYFDATGSKYAALSSDAAGKEGLNIHFACIDEFHVFTDANSRALYEAVLYGGRARRQPLLFIITTAGDDRSVLCRELHDYAAGILNGSIVDERFFAYIRAANPDDDWTNPATWKKANPSLGLTIDPEEFEADFREANRSPRSRAAFLRYSLNIWISSESAWIELPAWEKCRSTFTEDDFHGCECWAGLDMARTTAMTALCLVFHRDNAWYVLPYAWLPSRYMTLAECREEIKNFAEQGLIRITPGEVVDYERVFGDIRALAEKFHISELVYDPWNAEMFSQRVELELNIPRLAFRQTLRNYAGICREFERMILSQQIRHNGNPLLAWQIRNVTVTQDANGNMRPVRPGGDRSGFFIDNVVAMLMALARAYQVVSERNASPDEPVQFV